MTDTKSIPREGSLEAPTRHAIDWRDPNFSDQVSLDAELERVFDICHGCRRCFSLCNSFPTLFDMVDETETGEVDSVPKKAYWDVVEHCYLCDMCYMTKCPYVPPHEWNVDFPHLMLRAKAKAFQDGKPGWRDKLLSATDTVGNLAGIPVVAQTINAINQSKAGRRFVQWTLGVHHEAPVPKYYSDTARRRLRQKAELQEAKAVAANGTRGKVLIFATCYGNRNYPDLVEDLNHVFEHNGIPTKLAARERCCGMPKLELGDLEAIERYKNDNIEELSKWVKKGWDLVAPIPSCVLMFKQELPLLFPHDEKVRMVAAAFFDPFEYLMLRHKAGKLKTVFQKSLGKVSYQVPCHLRVQNIGLKTRDILELIPNTQVQAIERCSGHDGTYAVKEKYNAISRKIAQPVARQVKDAQAEHFTSDCPMAAEQIASIVESEEATHPIQLLRWAYGI
ncbi:MAG: heterodisulfide reductase-related iron-sulfur binding cluster [Pseudomonadota bacterium]|nr:heterodisulfide reductase-related iron-sulfur binding cluster [Pseudomonadota bacterium]